MDTTSNALGRTRDRMVAFSHTMRAVMAAASRAAAGSQPVFVDGEVGSGRKMLARMIHEEGPRCEQPFAVVHCDMLVLDSLDRVLFGDPRSGTIGKFEEAAEGTLLLADLENLNPMAQERLLATVVESRYITSAHESRGLSCRLVATGRRGEIERQMKVAHFSGELFEKLSAATLRMPPLSERKEDIPHLVTSVLHDLALREHIDMPSVPFHYMELLMDVSWPENVRQLKNHIESVMVLSGGAFDPQIIREHFVTEGSPATIRGAIESLLGRLRGVTANLATTTAKK